MFEESLVESTALLQTRNRWPALLSFATQAVVALLIIAIPMLHPELLPMHAPTLSLTPPPPHAPQPPPPLQHVRVALAENNAPEAPSVPASHPPLIRVSVPIANLPDDTAISNIVGVRMPGSPNILSGIGDVAGNSPNVTVAPVKPPAHVGPVPVSSGVTQGMLIAPIHPDYPAIARAAHVEGTVVVRAIISRSGTIESAQVLSGSAMLQQAALEAVERARYRPFLLNGQPTEVDTTVTITFRLGS